MNSVILTLVITFSLHCMVNSGRYSTVDAVQNMCLITSESQTSVNVPPSQTRYKQLGILMCREACRKHSQCRSCSYTKETFFCRLDQSSDPVTDVIGNTSDVIAASDAILTTLSNKRARRSCDSGGCTSDCAFIATRHHLYKCVTTGMRNPVLMTNKEPVIRLIRIVAVSRIHKNIIYGRAQNLQREDRIVLLNTQRDLGSQVTELTLDMSDMFSEHEERLVDVFGMTVGPCMKMTKTCIYYLCDQCIMQRTVKRSTVLLSFPEPDIKRQMQSMALAFRETIDLSDPVTSVNSIAMDNESSLYLLLNNSRIVVLGKNDFKKKLADITMTTYFFLAMDVFAKGHFVLYDKQRDHVMVIREWFRDLELTLKHLHKDFQLLCFSLPDRQLVVISARHPFEVVSADF